MTGPPLRLPHPDWLAHRLAITGPPATLAAFRAAASGPGLIPWHLDADRVEEDLFHRLLGAGTLSQVGAETLARQLREAVADRHRHVLAHAPDSHACPFDLHALRPVPAALLARGAEDPGALAWLWAEWGTTEPLRRVTLAEIPAPAPDAAVAIGFWSADWSPWRALAHIRAAWPGLVFDLRPDYGRR